MDLDAWLAKARESSGTLAGLLVALVVPFPLLQFVPDPAWSPAWLYWIVLSALELIAIGVWWYCRQGGRSAGKVRLALAIYCDREDQRSELEEDFVKTLRQILKEGNLGRDIEIVTASKGECRQLECDADFAKLSNRKRAHLLLYGRIRTRREEQQEVHLVELRANVRHAALNEHAKRAFTEEISSVFPSEMIRIPKSDQLPHFKITAEWVGFSSRYLISLAALTCGDFDYAEKILRDAELLLPRLSASIPQRTKLGDRLRLRQHEVAVMQARKYFAAWLVSRDVVLAERMRERLQFAETQAKLRPENVHLLAQAVFVTTLAADRAELLVRGAMFDHSIAHLNLAFLLAWQGKFSLARKSYRAAARRKPDADALNQVFSFFGWLAGHSPEQAYVCNWCEAVLRKQVGQDVGLADRMLGQLRRLEDCFPSDELARMQVPIAAN